MKVKLSKSSSMCEGTCVCARAAFALNGLVQDSQPIFIGSSRRRLRERGRDVAIFLCHFAKLLHGNGADGGITHGQTVLGFPGEMQRDERVREADCVVKMT